MTTENICGLARVARIALFVVVVIVSYLIGVRFGFFDGAKAKTGFSGKHHHQVENGRGTK